MSRVSMSEALKMVWADPEFKERQLAAIKAGFERAKASGKHVGRPAGSKNKVKAKPEGQA